MILPNGESEYVRYLKHNNAGDEFRENIKWWKKFFVADRDKNIQKEHLAKVANPNGVLDAYWKVKKEAIEKLKASIFICLSLQKSTYTQ